MPRTCIFASALFLIAAVFGAGGESALAAGAKKENAARKAECEREAILYIGELKRKRIRQCMAGNGRPAGKPAAAPGILPSSPTAMPGRVTPLGGGNPPSTSIGSTAPSNAPVAPSTPSVGSSGTSTTGSSATSTSGSSNSSIGGSGGASSSGGGK